MTMPWPKASIGTPWGVYGNSWSCDKNSSGQGRHTGVDFPAPVGQPIYATIAGTIRHRSYGSAFGNHTFAISPSAGQPFADGEVVFCHTYDRLKDGTEVQIGDLIAHVGIEGNVTGPHLHYEFHPRAKGVWNCSVHADPGPTLRHGTDGPYATKDIYTNRLGYGEPSNGDTFSNTVKELQERLNRISLTGGANIAVTGVYDDATDAEVRKWQEQVCGDRPDPARGSWLGTAQRAVMFPNSTYTIHERGLPPISDAATAPTTLGAWLIECGFDVMDTDVPLGRESAWRGVEFLMVHHTASPEGTSPASDARWIREGNEDAPLAQLMLDQQGRVWVCSRERDGQSDPGRASHAGAGSGFGVPDNRMNEVSLGIECCADGTRPLSEYPVMYETLLSLLAELSVKYNVPVSKIIGHKEWAPDRKTDPLDDMDTLRQHVSDVLGGDGGGGGDVTAPDQGSVKVVTSGGEVTITDAIAVLALVDGEWVELEIPGTTGPPPQIDYHETVAVGADIQGALDRASAWYAVNRVGPADFDDPSSMATVELAAGTHLLSTSLCYRRGVRLVMHGATLRKTAGTGNMFVSDSHGGGEYASPNYDWSIEGGTIDAGGISGGVSTVHVRRFRIAEVRFTGLGAKKHFIEINSSGGPVQLGVYNCEVLNCEFFQTKKPIGARAEDEAIQLDYSWSGAAPGTANDGTVTNNVRIEGCMFHHVPRAVGSHHWQRDAGDQFPKGFHTNVLVRGNRLWDIDPTDTGWGDGANGSNSEGAIRAYGWSHVTIEDNELTRCYQPINLYIPSDAMTDYGNPKNFVIQNNVIQDKTSSRAGILGDSARAGLRFDSVLISGNSFGGQWGGTTYAIAVNESGGAVSGHTTGVVITRNLFRPSNMTIAQEKAYNKYRAQNSANVTGVTIASNTVSDGATDNS